MTANRADERLHDFLDGRLGPEEARAFEAEMRADPDLSRRVDAYRGLGQALRRDPGELPVGFYTRARARFESASRPRARVLRWELVGLVAAAALAVALFGPDLVGPPERAVPVAPAPAFDSVAPAPPSESRPSDEEETVATKAAQAPAPRSEPAERGQRESDDRGSAAGAIPPAASRRDADLARPKREATLEKSSELTAERAPDSSAGAPSYQLGSARDGSTPRSRAVARTAVAFALEPGAAASGVDRVVGGQAPGERMLLVGPRARPLDCATTRIRSTPNGWQVQLRSATPGERGDLHGCAVHVPDDGRAVEVVEPPAEPEAR